VSQIQSAEKLKFLHAAVQETFVGILTGDPAPSSRALQEGSEEPFTKQQIEQIVRRVLKSELEDGVVRLLKKELKSGNFEELVTGVTSRALAKFFEIMFTRRSTWQNQLKGK